MVSSGRVVTGLAGAAAAVGLLAVPAAAHVSPDKREVPAGGYTDVAFSVSHGCEGSPTNRMEIQVPAQIVSVTPEVVPGWDIEVTTEALAEPVEGGHGEVIEERDAVVTFTARPGNELPDGLRLSFRLAFRAPDTPGEHLFFKTIQGCVEGETAWIEEYTGDGEEPPTPAPVVLVTASSGGGGHQPASDGGDDSDGTEPAGTDAGSDAEGPEAGDDGAELAVTPPSSAGDAGDDGASGVAIAGLVAGIVGIILGGAAFARARKA